MVRHENSHSRRLRHIWRQARGIALRHTRSAPANLRTRHRQSLRILRNPFGPRHAHAFDRADLAQHIKTLAPNLVVDASGPFQDYGDARYNVIETCIAAQTDYMDFADAADFVFVVSAFDQAAKAAGIYVLSGVSSFPVLTAAVLREIAKEFPITDVTGGIAPSP